MAILSSARSQVAACVSVDRVFHGPLAYIPALEYLSR